MHIWVVTQQIGTAENFPAFRERDLNLCLLHSSQGEVCFKVLQGESALKD